MTQQQMQQQPVLPQLLTPTQQLKAEKLRVTAQCSQQVQELNKDILFIQENASGLLMSGLSNLLFPKTKKSNNPSETVAVVPTGETPSTTVSFSDYLSLIPGLFPVIWDITRPIITAWGIKKVQHWFTNLLFGKKNKKKNN